MKNKLLVITILFGIATYFILINKKIKKNKKIKNCNFDNDLTICMSIISAEERSRCSEKMNKDMDKCYKTCEDNLLTIQPSTF